MGSFREQSFANRFAAMGDEAEGVFEAVYPEGFAAYGLRRPPINLKNVPAKVRFTPDFVTGKSLVEVQGFGRDQTAKFKHSKLDALSEWHADWRVDWFLWDTKNKQYGWVRHGDLLAALDEHGWADAFDGGANPYLAIRAEHLPVVDGWKKHAPQEAA